MEISLVGLLAFAGFFARARLRASKHRSTLDLSPADADMAEEDFSGSRTSCAAPPDVTPAQTAASAEEERGKAVTKAPRDVKEQSEQRNGVNIHDEEKGQKDGMGQLPAADSETRGSCKKKPRGSTLRRVLPTTSRTRAHQRLENDEDAIMVRVGCADPRMSGLELADAAIAAAQSRVRRGAMGHVRLAS